MSAAPIIEITFRTWPAIAWVRAMRIGQYVVGADRATRWAVAGVQALVRVRIGQGRWQRLPREAWLL